MTLDLTHRHATRVKAQNLVIEAIEAGLVFTDQLRLEAAGAVARDGDLDLAILGQNRLRTGPVTAVTAAATGRVALLVAQVPSQLGAQRALDQGLLQPLEKAIVASQVFRLLIVSKQLIKQFRSNTCFTDHVSLLQR